jgi:hypothetical protein
MKSGSDDERPVLDCLKRMSFCDGERVFECGLFQSKAVTGMGTSPDAVG